MADQAIVLGDNPSADAFGRLRVSSPVAQFEYQNQYNKGPLIWSERTAGGGVATHQPASSTVLLSTGDTSTGSLIARQTKSFFRYTPGKSLLVLMTFDLGKKIANVRKRVGYFCDENGIYLEQEGTEVYLVLRSSVSGSVVNTRVNQKDWNRDRLDGTGKSLIGIDWTKSQIFLMDIQWLGVGSVRAGFEIGGQAYVAHEFENANVVEDTYMTSANLPIRYEIENTGETAEAGELTQICSTVVTEQGAIDDKGFYTHGASNGITSTSVTTRRSVVTIRPKLLFGGQTNRARVDLDSIEIVAASQSVYWELVYGGTLGGSPTFSSVGDNSTVEYSTNVTTVTGGEVVASGYAVAGAAGNRPALSGKQIAALYPFTLDIDGANPESFSIVCTAFTSTSTVNAAINFREYY